MGQGLLIIGVLRSHSVRHIWTSNPPDTQTSTMTTHNTHKRQTFMHPVGFHAAIPAYEQPHTHALHRAATANSFIQFSETFYFALLFTLLSTLLYFPYVRTYLLIYSLTHSLPPSLTHSFSHSLTHSLTHSLNYSLHGAESFLRS